MPCRYLAPGDPRPSCRASEPLREPSREELRELCISADARRCAFHRFHRAAGRPLRLDDHLAWEKRRIEEQARARAQAASERVRGEGAPAFILESFPPKARTPP